jgi:threonine 3-dehydrogenase
MKALVKTKPEVGLWLEDVSPPLVGPNDVLIKIEKIAICGTDTHIYNWDEWAQQHVPLPLVIGHEFIGKVIEIGKEVQDYFKIGDRVSGENHIACGHCRNCRAGRAHLCKHNISIGVNYQGCFADFLCLPATNAYPIPDTISNEIGAILNPFGNAVHCALSFDLAGEDVLITGAGSVGMMAAAVAKHLGARHIVITDVNDYRLELAKKMGASLTVNPAKMTLKQVMDQLGMREGFDVGLEMSGNAQAFNDMVTHMNHAGKIALLGFLPDKTIIDWNKIIMKGITIKGIYGREMYDTWYKMISLLESGLNISSVITHEFSSDDFQKAFETMRAGESGKIILNWGS